MEDKKCHINLSKGYDNYLLIDGSTQLSDALKSKSDAKFNKIFDDIDAFTIISFDEEGVSFDTYATAHSLIKEQSHHNLFNTKQELLDALYAILILLDGKAKADEAYNLFKESSKQFE